MLGNRVPREPLFTGASLDVWAPGMDVALLVLSSACCEPFLCLTYSYAFSLFPFPRSVSCLFPSPPFSFRPLGSTIRFCSKESINFLPLLK